MGRPLVMQMQMAYGTGRWQKGPETMEMKSPDAANALLLLSSVAHEVIKPKAKIPSKIPSILSKKKRPRIEQPKRIEQSKRIHEPKPIEQPKQILIPPLEKAFNSHQSVGQDPS